MKFLKTAILAGLATAANRYASACALPGCQMLASIANYLITNWSIGISHIYFVGVSTVSYELLYLGDGYISEVTVFVPPHLATR